MCYYAGVFERRLLSRLKSSSELFRVTVLNGPRQSGKTTVLQSLVAGGGSYVTFDDQATREQALGDPMGFVQAFPLPLAIDEVQRVGEPIVLAVKALVDANRKKGQFILAGSTRFLTTAQIAESLAGRAEILDLWPLSQGEIAGVRETFVETAFREPKELMDRSKSIKRRDFFQRVVTGGYPEVVLQSGSSARWFKSYVRTVVERDIVSASAIRQASELPRVLRLLAANTAGELVPGRFAADLGLSDDVTRRYLGLLELVGWVVRVPAWAPSLTTREKRHAKAHLVDTGLACSLLGLSVDSLALPTSTMAGALFESFVATEVAKQITWSETQPTMRHWRDRTSGEIDIILEADDGRVVAIETKASMSVTQSDLKHLTTMRDRLGERFVGGFFFYLGERPAKFGDRIWALPVATLWNG